MIACCITESSSWSPPSSAASPIVIPQWISSTYFVLDVITVSQRPPAASPPFLFLVLFCLLAGLLSALLAVGAWLPLSTFAVVRSASRVAFSGVTVPPERRWLSCLAWYKMIASPLDPTAMGIRAEYEIPRRIAVFLSRHLMVKFGAIC
jgi:hypothetical protein